MEINIPTALSLKEAELLRKLSEGKNILEIGSLLGFSTVNMAKKARIVTSIDPHKDYPFVGAESTIDKFVMNLHRYCIGNVTIIQDIFENVEIDKHDSAFIDLDGTYETTKKVLEYTKDIPLVVIHDYGRSNCSGIARAIKKLNANIVQVVDTCAIIRNIK